MIYLAHRGWWRSPEEKNTPEAFRRALESGYGIETDLRDLAGSLVISHDPPGRDAMSTLDFFALYRAVGSTAPLALNIKSDGLQTALKQELRDFEIENFFVFDMSVPDSLGYVRQEMRFFTRQSEYETVPPLYGEAVGVWLDAFETHWFTDETVREHLAADKDVALVSPELHGRPHLPAWEAWAALAAEDRADRLMLCTDFPEMAQQHFGGQ